MSDECVKTSQSLENMEEPALLVEEGCIPPAVLAAGTQKVTETLGQERATHPQTYIFFSFDIVNSTRYKATTGNWPLVIRSLLDTIRERVVRTDSLSDSRLWRVIGDEMIFITPVRSKANLREIVSKIFEVTQKVSISLKCGKFFDSIQGQELKSTEIETLKSQNTLSIKAAAWIAVINAQLVTPYDNIAIHYEGSAQDESISEFLGEDIDAGFRLKAYTQDRRLCLSVELAAFIEKKSLLYVMDYTRLKGVWNESLYPVIWYYDEDAVSLCQEEITGERQKIPFANSFRYDETDQNPIVQRFFARGGKKQRNFGGDIASNYSVAPCMFVAESAIKKIIADRNMQTKLNYIEKFFADEPQMIEIHPAPLELHCAVVCCDTLNRRVFATRRSENHRTNPQKWEFGCARALSNEALAQTVTKQYLQAFGLRIELCMDKSRDDQQPLPLAVYELSKTEGNIAKGVIFVAKVVNPLDADNFRPEGKHTEVKWVSRENINEIPDNEAVKDFKRTLTNVLDNMDYYFDA